MRLILLKLVPSLAWLVAALCFWLAGSLAWGWCVFGAVVSAPSFGRSNA